MAKILLLAGEGIFIKTPDGQEFEVWPVMNDEYRYGLAVRSHATWPYPELVTSNQGGENNVVIVKRKVQLPAED